MSTTPTLAIYKLRFAEGFEWLIPLEERDFEALRFDTTSRARSWRPVQMKRLTRLDRDRPLMPSDFPACSGGDMLIVGGAAKEAIGQELERYGELLPLACSDGQFWAFNVTTLVDALDEGGSQLFRASDTGGILMIREHVFRVAAMGRAGVFKLPQTPRGLIYMTQEFAGTVRSAGLLGLEFVQVWATNQR